MNKVYRHRPDVLDEYLGYVTPEGEVYEARLGPAKYAGRVDLDTGEILSAQNGRDRPLGRVEADSGKVYVSRQGPDQYLGRVHPDGKIYLHRTLAPNDYLGRVEEMTSLLHGGAAFLLLVQPAVDEVEAMEADLSERPAEDPGLADEAPGEAPAPA